jgi:hypothetical protein
MRAFLRFLAGVLLLVAVLAAVYDGTRSLAAGSMVATSLLEHWTKLAPVLLTSAQNSVRRATHPAVWDQGVRQLLLVPTWAAFAALGLILAYLGRRRRRINVFAN